MRAEVSPSFSAVKKEEPKIENPEKRKEKEKMKNPLRVSPKRAVSYPVKRTESGRASTSASPNMHMEKAEMTERLFFKRLFSSG